MSASKAKRGFGYSEEDAKRIHDSFIILMSKPTQEIEQIEESGGFQHGAEVLGEQLSSGASQFADDIGTLANSAAKGIGDVAGSLLDVVVSFLKGLFGDHVFALLLIVGLSLIGIILLIKLL